MKGKITEYILKSLPGVKAIYATGIFHDFTRHAHESYVLGAVLKGVRVIRLADDELVVNMGDVFQLLPFQEHSCGILEQQMHDYIAISVSIDELALIGADYKDAFSALFLELFDVSGCTENNQELENNIQDKVRSLDFAPETLGKSMRESGLLRAGVDFINEYYYLKLSLEDVADYVGMSKYNFQRKFTEYFGMSPAEMLAKKRVCAGLSLLGSGEKASMAALKCGFADQSHFCRVVKKLTGVTAANYIKN